MSHHLQPSGYDWTEFFNVGEFTRVTNRVGGEFQTSITVIDERVIDGVKCSARAELFVYHMPSCVRMVWCVFMRDCKPSNGVENSDIGLSVSWGHGDDFLKVAKSNAERYG